MPDLIVEIRGLLVELFDSEDGFGVDVAFGGREEGDDGCGRGGGGGGGWGVGDGGVEGGG